MVTKVAAIMMMKDEEDVAYHVISHLADEVDMILVADNNSQDGTRAELERAARDVDCPVEILDDPEPAYHQSEKMTALAKQAFEGGAKWIVPVDADEIWVGRDRLKVDLNGVPDHVIVVDVKLYNHFCTAVDAESDNPFKRMVWRQHQPGALPKVAVRWASGMVIQQGNHDVLIDDAAIRSKYRVSALEIRHFPYRSLEQMVHKAKVGAAAYAADPMIRADYGLHWRQWGELLDRYGEDALREVWEKYYHFLSPVDAGMTRDPAPFCRWHLTI